MPAQVAVHFAVAVAQFEHNSVAKRFQSQPERYETWFGNEVELNISSVEPGTLLFDINVPARAQTGAFDNPADPRLRG